MRIAVMGPGNIGSTLGRIWAGAGHDVTFTYSRDPGSLEARAAEAGARAVPDAAAAVPTPTSCCCRCPATSPSGPWPASGSTGGW